jgi:acyl-CoA synthetase (AMP-forming)/AMP-acid ligase II
MNLPAGVRNHLVAGSFEGTWADLAPVAAPDASAFFVASHADALRVVWTHVTSTRQESLIGSAVRADAFLIDELGRSGLAVVHVDRGSVSISPTPVPRLAVPRRIWLLTSGSTGRPKRVAHTLESLTTVRGRQPARTWLCPYTPGAYAWWQIVTLALTIPGQGVVFVPPDRLDSWVDLALAQGVTAASGTPTFWRQAMLRSGKALAQVPLAQVTLGGEPVDQAVLDQVAAAFPRARVSWIYASSEAGASIAVHDGLAGFPEDWLSQHSSTSGTGGDRPLLSIDRDELVIASPHRGVGVEQFLHTGDRVEVRDGRVHITGRLASDEINVGGTKVSAAEVRGVLLEHPGVAWASARGRRAPLVGTIVQAEVVLSNLSVTENDLARHCAARLSDFAVPRQFRFLDSIPLTEGLKSDV